MDLNDFAKEVHALCVEKGFYESKPTDPQIIAGIHSEISEAFEEWRAGRPMVWYRCTMEPDKSQTCGEENCGYACMSASGSHWRDDEHGCDACKRKPEGIAVELIDAVLRTLNAAADWEVEINQHAFDVIDAIAEVRKIMGLDIGGMELAEFVAELHVDTCKLLDFTDRGEFYRSNDTYILITELIQAIFIWVKAHGIDPEALMREKHAYNQTRPYKHGGKRF